MKYNVYIQYLHGKYHIWGISDEELQIITDAYFKGNNFFTLSGKKFYITDLFEIRIFTLEKEISEKDFMNNCKGHGILEKSLFVNFHLPPKALNIVGKDITGDILGNTDFGAEMMKKREIKKEGEQFISETRITELKQIRNEHWDLIKLIKLCEELNYNYKEGNYLTVGMIGRTIINHIPPIFDAKTFTEVANNIAGSSLKKSLRLLDESLKNIVDRILHEQIKKTETLPSEAQIDFKQIFDVVLEAIVRLLK